MISRFFRVIMITLFSSVPLAAMAQQPATAPTQPLLKQAELSSCNVAPWPAQFQTISLDRNCWDNG